MIIKEVHLYTNDLNETKNFYGKEMFFNIAEQTMDSFSFKAGDSLVIFHEIKNEKTCLSLCFSYT